MNVTEMLEQINAVTVTREELVKVARAIEAQPPADRDLSSLMSAVAEQCGDEVERAASVFFRIQALGRLVKTEELPGWALPEAETGGIPVRGPLLMAAAVVPIREDDQGRAAFDRETLLQKALEFAPHEGEG